MDLLPLMVIMVLSYIVLNIRPTKYSELIFASVMLIFGLFIAQEGLTYGSTVVTSVNTLNNFVLITVLLLGGFGQMLNAIVKRK